MKRERIADTVSELKEELASIEQVVRGIRDAARRMPESPELSDIFKESIALKLHNFYTGCERIFKTIAGEVNGGVPTTSDWHRRLLKVMSLEIENVRPPVISRSTADALSDYLAFRHIVRNIYGYELELKRITPLLEKVGDTYESFNSEIQAFIEFLGSMR
jgi:hypothetical protein